MENTTKTYRSFLVSALVLVTAIASFGHARPVAAYSTSQVTCNFYRDLTLGSYGDDVTCLNQMLSAAGYAAYGNLYTVQTRASVAAWQATNGIYPASGFFGGISRSRYIQMYGGYTTNYQYGYTSTNQTTDILARNELVSVHDLLRETRDDYENALDDRIAVRDAVDFLDDGDRDLINGLIAYLNGNFSSALTYARSARTNAEDAADEIGTSSSNRGNRQDARDEINTAENDIDDARNEIDNAYDDGANVREANNRLDDAQNSLDDANSAYDDGDYHRAIDYARDAQDLAQEAVDAIRY
jgi:hypothetical protein